MGNWLVVPKGTSLARRTRARQAAQYVRMSRELQRYSIKNQMAAIAAYAEANALTIVRTYADEGRNGLRIKGRPGLIELIDDVQSGQPTSITSSSTMSVGGAASRTSTRARNTNSCVSEAASRWNTAPSSSRTTAHSSPGSQKVSSAAWPQSGPRALGQGARGAL